MRQLVSSRSASDWSNVLKLAGAHLVTPAFAGALERRGLIHLVPEEERDYLEIVRSLNRDRNDVLRGELVRIVSALNAIGITPLLLKGAISLALPDHYPGAADRVVGDLDIVVERERALEARDCIIALNYAEPDYGLEWSTEEERDRHHHLPPLTHNEMPVCVEVHRRIVKVEEEDRVLAAAMRASSWHAPGGGRALIPDPATRIAHNFVHSQVSNRLGPRRLFNLRHLHEFASLVSHYQASVTGSDVRAAVTVARQQELSEHWALAETWLGASFPADLSRSAREARELWLTERVMQSAVWRKGSDVVAFASTFPMRAKIHLDRFRSIPGYPREFARRVARRMFEMASSNDR